MIKMKKIILEQEYVMNIFKDDSKKSSFLLGFLVRQLTHININTYRKQISK